MTFMNEIHSNNTESIRRQLHNVYVNAMGLLLLFCELLDGF